jgi:hypothetical protein
MQRHLALAWIGDTMFKYRYILYNDPWQNVAMLAPFLKAGASCTTACHNNNNQSL